MKFLIICILSLLSASAFSSDILVKRFVDKKNNDSIDVYCSLDVEGKCESIRLESMIKGLKHIRHLAMAEGKRDKSIEDLIVEKELAMLKKAQYNNLALTHKACRSGQKPKGNMNCIIGGAFVLSAPTAMLLIAGVATVPSTLLVTSLVMVLADGSLSGVLVTPALIGDGLRFLTVKPIKKIISKIQLNTYKKNIEPILRDLEADLSSDELADQEDVEIKHRFFKKLQKLIFNP